MPYLHRSNDRSFTPFASGDSSPSAVQSESGDEIECELAAPTLPELQATARLRDLRGNVEAHPADATKTARLEDAARQRDLARRDAIEALTSLSFETNLQTMLGAIDDYGAIAGLVAAEIAAVRARETSQLIAGRLARVLNEENFKGRSFGTRK